MKSSAFQHDGGTVGAAFVALVACGVDTDPCRFGPAMCANDLDVLFHQHFSRGMLVDDIEARRMLVVRNLTGGSACRLRIGLDIRPDFDGGVAVAKIHPADPQMSIPFALVRRIAIGDVNLRIEFGIDAIASVGSLTEHFGGPCGG